ncbi:hypothetical protein MHYP_G00246810 [Metynnis hypsauchen]
MSLCTKPMQCNDMVQGAEDTDVQNPLCAPWLIPKPCLITVEETVWLLLQALLDVKGLRNEEEQLYSLRFYPVDVALVQGVGHPHGLL